MFLPDPSALTLLAAFIEIGFVLGIAGTWLAVRRVELASRRTRWVKLAIYFLIVHGCFLVAVLGRAPLALFLCLIALAGVWEICRLNTPWRIKTAAAALWLGDTVTGLMFFLPHDAGWFLWVYAQVAVLDAYSQIIGQLWGRHQLAKTISPAKTWEGAMGGFFCAVLAGTVLRGLVGLSWERALSIAVVLALTAIAADLAAAKYKRVAAVKDYSRLIPGHGGVVDRFNSLLGVALILGTASWLLPVF